MSRFWNIATSTSPARKKSRRLVTKSATVCRSSSLGGHPTQARVVVPRVDAEQAVAFRRVMRCYDISARPLLCISVLECFRPSHLPSPSRACPQRSPRSSRDGRRSVLPQGEPGAGGRAGHPRTLGAVQRGEDQGRRGGGRVAPDGGGERRRWSNMPLYPLLPLQVLFVLFAYIQEVSCCVHTPVQDARVTTARKIRPENV